MSSPFASPATASGVKWDELKGALLIFDVTAYEDSITTSYGDTPAVRADLSVVDGDQGGQQYSETLVFPKVLISQLRPNVGKKVLGRLGQGQAKQGQSAPWMLQEASEDDQKAATAFLNQLSRPAPAAGQSKPPF